MLECIFRHAEFRAIAPELRCIMFDLDGTLLNTRGFAVRALRSAVSEYNSSSSRAITLPTDIEICSNFGVPANLYYRYLLRPWSHEAEVVVHNLVMEEQRSVFRSRDDVLFEGVSDLVRELKAEGRVIGVASSGSEAYLEAASGIQGLAGNVDFWHATSDDPIRQKSDAIRSMLNYAGCSSGAMVGDRATDIAAARRARVYSVGCRYGYGRAEETAGATQCVETIEELSCLLLGRTRSLCVYPAGP